MFVATANTLNIPPALLDRMEVIRLSGYTEDEKINIAQRYLLPKQMKNNGLKREELSVTEEAVRDIVRYYTREAGVRSLEREISKVCRKVVKQLVLKSRTSKVVVNAKTLDKFLGVRKYSFGMAEKENQVGQVTGLGMDRGRRRTADHRGGAAARQGQGGHHRQARRGDAGVHPGRAFGGAPARSLARHRPGLLPEERHPHPPAGRRDPQGRAVGGHRDLDRTGVGADRHPGALRRRDDRRDHPARRGAGDRRPQGEAARRGAGRHPHRA